MLTLGVKDSGGWCCTVMDGTQKNDYSPLNTTEASDKNARYNIKALNFNTKFCILFLCSCLVSRCREVEGGVFED